ncbi:DNA polymerase III beta subunit, central domain [Rhodococcus tukisamuensis]|uniref:DNA polymerase III beta subunit, central domain n=2 Tax=Rhodococcus tukisamuensis TaxID=168276 RepID=A0A1G6Z633_9NOCA|nr:DNA polymerase III beta subunit, central domain [Rhodococcus tukisamuensis]
MSIGSFASRSGLTASALRFYADARLLLPAEVDPDSGYRFYGEDQLERAVLLRQLREIGMPLATAKSVLDAGRNEAVRLVDQHVDAVVSGATAARQQAAVIKAALAAEPAVVVVALSGPVLAAAIEQVLTATTDEPDIAVLGGVRFESDTGAVTVTATDRYRLSTRTLVTADPTAATWAATVNGEDLRSCLGDLRRTPLARIEATEQGMWIRLPDRGDRHCRLLPEPFPDYRSMLDALPAVTTRVEASKSSLLRALEERPADRVSMHVTEAGVTVLDNRGGPDTGVHLPARVSGPSIEAWFEMTTLYPAISTAIGADVLLDLRGPAQPATVRSADHGDLTTLAMPTKPHPRDNTTNPKGKDT